MATVATDESYGPVDFCEQRGAASAAVPIVGWDRTIVIAGAECIRGRHVEEKLELVKPVDCYFCHMISSCV